MRCIRPHDHHCALEGLLDPQAQQSWEEFDAQFRPDPSQICDETGAGRRRRRGRHAGGADAFRQVLPPGQVRPDPRAAVVVADFHRGALHRRPATEPAGRLEHRGESAIVNLSDDERPGVVWDEQCRQVLLEHGMRELGRQASSTRRRSAHSRCSPSGSVNQLTLPPQPG